MDEENNVKQTMKMEVRSTRAKGRPRIRWMYNMRHDMNKCGLDERSLNTGEDEEG